MNLEIKLATDFFDFFDNRAFTDNSPMQPCYCCSDTMSEEQHKTDLFGQVEANGGGREGFKRALRKCAERQIASSIIKGYLAFADGKAITTKRITFDLMPSYLRTQLGEQSP